MAKKQNTQSRRNGPKKSLVGKKAGIDKLIEASKSISLSQSNSAPYTSSIRLPPRHPNAPNHSPHKLLKYNPNRVVHPVQPKQIVPGLPEPEHQLYLIRDRRCHDKPEVPLVRLPCEPSTSRALRFTPRGHFPFLELPGELRNKIYELAIPKEHYSIKWVYHNQKSKSLTYCLPRQSGFPGPQLSPDTAQRRRLLDFHHRRASNKHLPEECLQNSPTVLLLVCKRISKEATTVFYAKSMFYFNGLGTLRFFLDHLRPVAMTSIKKLSLKYRAYGNPLMTENQRWKVKHDRLWEALCWRVADECSLTHLNIELILNKSPWAFSKFDEVEPTDLGTRWIRPLWAFQDAGIERCWGRIQCISQSDSVLEEKSLEMRKEILGELWDEKAEESRDAFGFEKVKKTPKDSSGNGLVFRLRIDGHL